MTPKGNKDKLARIIAICGCFVAFLTGLYQVFDYYSDKEKDDKLNKIEINQLLYEAHDQMGDGIEGTLTIELSKPSTNVELRQLEIAHRKIQEALILDPKFSRTLNYLGIYLFKMDKLQDSKKAFEDAYNSDNQDPKILSNLAMSFYSVGSYDDAIKYYKMAIAIESTSPRHNNLGINLNQKNETEKAINEFKKAIELNSEESSYYYNLGNA